MVAAPPAVEGLRERYRLHAPWARVARDLAIAPFFGNSIASRLPLVGSSSSSGSGSSSGGGGSSKGGAQEQLLLGGFRAAQRVCIEVAPSDADGVTSSDWSSDCSSDDFAAAGGGSGAFAGGSSTFAGRFGPDSSSSSSSSSSTGQQEPLKVWLVNTHLDHASAETREEQAKVGWKSVLECCEV
jgi:hypothetical protein